MHGMHPIVIRNKLPGMPSAFSQLYVAAIRGARTHGGSGRP